MLVFSFGNGKIWNSDGDPNYMYFLELLLISWTFPRGGSGGGGGIVCGFCFKVD